MELEEADQWLNSSSEGGHSILEYAIGIDPIPLNPGNQEDEEEELDWDPKTMLTNLSFLEQKIHHLQNLVHLMAAGRGSDLTAQQQKQHLVTADVTSIIAQLISAAGSLLPSARHNNSNNNDINNNNNNNNNNCNNNNNPNNNPNNLDDHELKDEEDAEEGESLAPGTYEILQLEKEEILAPHTHFCAICGKGFKRDANLRMHMRGHGDEYKTPAALAKPHRDSSGPPEPKKRYSCPFAGCKRNRDHKKFQPLKTILCVKNHYKRTHCDKSYACSRCKTKKFSVIADLKTHEKHCGRDKWLCSCGTTFSRKDKLFGHISLFQGHTPAIPADETKPSGGSAPASVNFNFGPDSPGDGAAKIGVDDDQGALFSPIDFESCNFGGFHEFPRPPYEDSLEESSFSFLLAGSCSNYPPKSVRDSDSNNLV